MKQNMMNLAWLFVRKNNTTMSEGMILAWRNVKLSKRMMNSSVHFTFKKSDGSIRRAEGTLVDVQSKIKGTGRKPNMDIQVFFDVEKSEFRSFKKENLIEVL